VKGVERRERVPSALVVDLRRDLSDARKACSHCLIDASSLLLLVLLFLLFLPFLLFLFFLHAAVEPHAKKRGRCGKRRAALKELALIRGHAKLLLAGPGAVNLL
jgi:hypothetical protein